jgi:dynactin-4
MYVSSDLKPLRIPLHSKSSKRCPTCRHILIKPEQKAQSVRYKIKLVAANYLPAITVALPHTQPASDVTKLAKTTAADDDKSAGPTIPLIAGKTYPFHLALTNPLYDPIQVRLSVQRMHVSAAPTSDGSAPEKARRPPFAVSLPTSTFPIAAFAEAWEYDDDEDMFGIDDDEFSGGQGGKGTREKDGRGKMKTVGVLEKKANMTMVGGEVVIGKEARGSVKVCAVDCLATTPHAYISVVQHAGVLYLSIGRSCAF